MGVRARGRACEMTGVRAIGRACGRAGGRVSVRVCWPVGWRTFRHAGILQCIQLVEVFLRSSCSNTTSINQVGCSVRTHITDQWVVCRMCSCD